MRVECFLIEDAGVCHRYLRRHALGPCAAMPGEYGYHNAMAFIDRAPTPRTPEGFVDGTIQWPREDPRWPTACACGYVFTESDRWDLFVFDLWKRVDGQLGEFSLHANPEPPTLRAPAGAMWDAWWHHGSSWTGPDGRSIGVMLPDGTDWHIDGPSKGGSPWSREGTPPNITARPSILTPGYHGFLTNGVLESC